jgi:hypothetical protein
MLSIALTVMMAEYLTISVLSSLANLQDPLNGIPHRIFSPRHGIVGHWELVARVPYTGSIRNLCIKLENLLLSSDSRATYSCVLLCHFL